MVTLTFDLVIENWPLLFSANNENKWELAMSKVGIKTKKLNNITFSPDSGSA